MGQKKIEAAEKGALYIFLAGLALIVLGTAALPAVLAVLFCWRWLLMYPATLVAFLIWTAWRHRQ